ncbi:MAG: MBL fold metallo-hydrolase [Longimicrobiales bacterium]
MRVWIVGSGTLRPDPDRGPPGHWVEIGGDRILMDCGSGTLRTLARLGRAWEAVTTLFVSHFHADHVGELAPLLFALKHGGDSSRTRPLTVLGPRGISDHMDALARAHGRFVLDPGFPVEIVDLDPGTDWASPRGTFRVRTYDTRHADPSLAFRLETDDSILGYTGDTGQDRELGRFLSGCQLLVAECSNVDGADTTNHLTPETLAELASLARPELLVTVHVYPPLSPEEVPDLLARRGYHGTVLAGRDGLVITLRAGAVEDWSFPP